MHADTAVDTEEFIAIAMDNGYISSIQRATGSARQADTKAKRHKSMHTYLYIYIGICKVDMQAFIAICKCMSQCVCVCKYWSDQATCSARKLLKSVFINMYENM